MPSPFLEEYQELRSLAGKHLRRYSSSPTWQATALVHEVYLKLARGAAIDTKRYADRKHFICTAATAMRHILVDHARNSNRMKRGGEMRRITLDGLELASPAGIDVLMLHDLLDRLKVMDERQAQVVELRFFVGLSVEEVAELLDVSQRSVKRDWSMARAWLQRELSPEQPS